ncbi:MAG: LysM peptidoglycan-binding domain-containing protein, partial [Chloroflexi bacterium]|nr:LysM peptidoglycan-binding domain-containing protein [Chloroflexota bacterium]
AKQAAAQAAATVTSTVTGVAATVAKAKRTYTVKGGDSLSVIAKSELGSGARWPGIYELNKQLIGNNPDLIHPGQVLEIPEK